jgi:hypothetical protein
MVRKTFIAMAAVAALGVSASAVAAKGAHGGHPGGHSAMVSSHVSSPIGAGRMTNPANFATFGPHKTFAGGPFIRHHHHHHRNAFFFGAGFAGPWYDYGYSSCWSLVPTAWGWRRVWVCDYPYGGWW